MKWVGLTFILAAMACFGVGIGVYLNEPTPTASPIRSYPMDDGESIEPNSAVDDALANRIARDVFVEYSTPDAVEDVHQRLNQIRSHWKGSSDYQLEEAINIIHEAKIYWPAITLGDCIEYLINEIPGKLVTDTTGYETKETVDGENRRVEHTTRAQQTTLSTTGSSVIFVAREIYTWLEQEYHRPAIEAEMMRSAEEARRQQVMRQNLESIRQRGELENQRRAEELRRASGLPDWAAQQVRESEADTRRRIESGHFGTP